LGTHTEQEYEETYQIPAKFGGFLFPSVKLKLGGRFRDSTQIIIMQEKSLEKNPVIANFLWCIKLGTMQKLVQYFLYLLLNAI
jgi:hypothetical protein